MCGRYCSPKVSSELRGFLRKSSSPFAGYAERAFSASSRPIRPLPAPTLSPFTNRGVEASLRLSSKVSGKPAVFSRRSTPPTAGQRSNVISKSVLHALPRSSRSTASTSTKRTETHGEDCPVSLVNSVGSRIRMSTERSPRLSPCCIQQLPTSQGIACCRADPKSQFQRREQDGSNPTSARRAAPTGRGSLPSWPSFFFRLDPLCNNRKGAETTSISDANSMLKKALFHSETPRENFYYTAEIHFS